MRLLEALGAGVEMRLALTGAGGKTTAMFQLARQLLEKTPRVLVSASTHLAEEQLALADQVITIAKGRGEFPVPPPGVTLLIGEPVGEERRAGLPMQVLDELRRLADELGAPLLVEADGSRRRPLKAPAAYEPVVPAWVDGVLVTAGMSGLGRPLGEEWVHRPQLFSQLSGLSLGETLTAQALAGVLTSPQGGLKGIPPSARRALLLNQADTPQLQAAAQNLAQTCQAEFPRVLIAALQGDAGVLAVRQPVAGIVLAAGASRRFNPGENTTQAVKQLLPWRGEALVRHVARAALQAGLGPVLVVTGCAAEAVQAALAGLPVEIVSNPAWQDGQSSSLIAGLRSLPDEVGAAVFLLADQPQTPPELVRALVEQHAGSLAPVIAPMVDGKRANPVLFDRSTFADLLALRGDTGGRTLFSRYPVAWLPWHDPTAALDVDTPEDYQRLQELEG
jgi:molybdenum cofactor cytidylyltransferase